MYGRLYNDREAIKSAFHMDAMKKLKGYDPIRSIVDKSQFWESLKNYCKVTNTDFLGKNTVIFYFSGPKKIIR